MNHDHFLQDRVALVTGAASGIGRAVAVELAKAGARLLLTDVNADAGEATAGLVQAVGSEAMFVGADVTDLDAVTALVDAGIEHFGRLDIAVNSAGIEGPLARTAAYGVADWKRVMDVNVNGVWYCMRAELPPMVAQGSGVIVNIASVAGLVGFPSHAAYAASKHAVIGLTRTAALEYVRWGVRINAVCPGYTDTPMLQSTQAEAPEYARRLLAATPARRAGRPEEIAGAVLYLCRDESAFMIGHALVLDGGISAG